LDVLSLLLSGQYHCPLLRCLSLLPKTFYLPASAAYFLEVDKIKKILLMQDF
jgi:hypothetical protein